MAQNYNNSHKRQRSSMLNANYFFGENPSIDPTNSSISHNDLQAHLGAHVNLSAQHIQSTSSSGLGFTENLNPSMDPSMVPDQGIGLSSRGGPGQGQGHGGPSHGGPSLTGPTPDLSAFSPTGSNSTHSPILDQQNPSFNPSNRALDLGIYETIPYTPLNYNFPPQPQDRSNVFYSVNQSQDYYPVGPGGTLASFNPAPYLPPTGSGAPLSGPAPAPALASAPTPGASSMDPTINSLSQSQPQLALNIASTGPTLSSMHPSSYNMSGHSHSTHLHTHSSHPNVPNHSSLHQSPLSSSSVPSSPGKSIRSRAHSRTNSKSHIKSHSRTNSRSTQRPINTPNTIFQSPTGPKQSSSRPQKLPSLTLPRHKSNMSISSHFNLFNLSDSDDNKPDDPKHNELIFKDLLNKLLEIVDQQSVTTFLLFVLYKLDYPVPLDDFYNALYNEQSVVLIDFDQKLDKTSINSNYLQNYLDIINRVLDLFKNPEALNQYTQNNPNSLLIGSNEGTSEKPSSEFLKNLILSNVNYHELLRTFLAIKILQDMFIELPKDTNKDLTSFNIPRLSLYKTYYIICQTLLLKYPSSLTSNNDHHKLILGQSKLGKLIKLVYPNLLIKRLGSRGESKYHYLGVVWNENLINDEVRSLCNNHELEELNGIFESQYKSKFESFLSEPGSGSGSGAGTNATTGPGMGPRPGTTSTRGSDSLTHLPGQIQSLPPGTTQDIMRPLGDAQLYQTRSNSSNSNITLDHQQSLQPQPSGTLTTDASGLVVTLPFNRINEEFNHEYTNPIYSFITNNLKVPENFDISNYVQVTKEKLYQSTSEDQKDSESEFIKLVLSRLMEEVFLNNYEVNQDLDLGANFINKFNELNHYLNDLKIYLLILLELVPIMLLMNPIENFKLLKVNLINFLKIDVSNENINTENFLKFKLILKNLVNLNDLLIHLIKILFKDQKMVNNLNDLFNFQSDDLMDNLINSLISFNFNPDLILNPSFLTNQIDHLKNFYLVELINYLKTLYVDDGINSGSGSDTISSHNSNSSSDTAINSRNNSNSEPFNLSLSSNEYANLLNFLHLINNLTNKFNHLPVIILINFINLISNDHLKLLYFKNLNVNNNSFNHWWSINCFIQDYLNLIGELIGLYNEIYNIL